MIESALSWIGDLAHFAGSLLPRLLVVQSSHRAVKYRNGWRPMLLGPGLHVYWPVASPIETCAVVRQVLDVRPHLLETADGEAVVASGVVEYEIVDVVRFLASTENGYESILAVAGAAIRELVVESTLAELRENDDVGRRLLAAGIQEALEPYGVLVLGARLADCARVRAVHLTGIEARFGHVSSGTIAD